LSISVHARSPILPLRAGQALRFLSQCLDDNRGPAIQGKLDVVSGAGSYVRVDSVNGDLHANGGADGAFGIFNDSPGAAQTVIVMGGVARLAVIANGNVGIGTTAPAAALDVRGDIRLGSTGQLKATSGEENLRIVRGVFSAEGVILAGSGYTVSHPDIGVYVVTFSPSFASAPTVTCTAHNGSNRAYVVTEGVTASAANLLVVLPSGWHSNEPVHFIAIGPR
jgi:hypothetical protein